jgi:putative FmdB family regulatory protein
VPLYEYKCPKCRHVFERIQKFSDKPEANCPKCDIEAERQLSAPAVHFKGGGWYITDSRKDKKDRDAKAKQASSSDSKDSSSATKEAASDKSKSKTDTPTKKEAKPKKKD